MSWSRATVHLAVAMLLCAPSARAVAGQLADEHAGHDVALRSPSAADEVPGFATWFVRNMDVVVERAIADSASPGVAVAVGYGGRVVFARGWGRLDWADDSPPVTERTVWDLASVTKVVATTVAAMMLVEEGRLDLDAPLWTYLRAWPSDGPAGLVTPRRLLDHTSGLPAGAPVWRYGETTDERVRGIAAVGFQAFPGEREIYSDLGPILMGFVIEAVAGESLESFVERRVYAPLGMDDTGFRPLDAGVPLVRIAPTERLKNVHLRGVVHDPNARSMGGVAGNAGVFSSAADLAVLASAVLWERPRRLVCRDVVKDFTRRTGSDVRFGSGWEMPAYWAIWSEVLSESAFGHTGFTGTSLWIDPEQDLFVVLMSSRVNPTAANVGHLRLRRELHDLVKRAHLHLEEEERATDWRIPETWRGVDSCSAETAFDVLRRIPRWHTTLR